MSVLPKSMLIYFNGSAEQAEQVLKDLEKKPERPTSPGRDRFNESKKQMINSRYELIELREKSSEEKQEYITNEIAKNLARSLSSSASKKASETKSPLLSIVDAGKYI